MDKRRRIGVVMYSLSAVLAAVLTIQALVNGSLWLGAVAAVVSALAVIMIILTARKNKPDGTSGGS